jgi:hypothetical protein
LKFSLKEITIIQSELSEFLNEQDFKALEHFFSNEDELNGFYIKLLNVLLEIDKTISLEQFLELYPFILNAKELASKKEQIIQKIAELFISGYSSSIIIQLQTAQDKIFLTHVTFLNDIKKGIKDIERKELKKKLINLSKINDFDLTELEIKAAIKQIERKRLKDKLIKIAEKNQIHIRPNKKFYFNYPLLLTLIIISSIALAISVPSIRKFIQKTFNDVFKQEKKSEPIMPPTKPFKLDTLKDSVSNEIIPLKTDSTKKENLAIKTTKKTSSDFLIKKDDLTSYKNYFNENRHELKEIEGIWKIKETNSPEYSCAIFKTSKNKFEIRYFNQNGIWERKDHSYFFVFRDGENTAIYKEYLENNEIGSGIIKFSSTNSFKCNYKYNPNFIKIIGLPDNTKAEFILTAKKS